MHVSTHIAGLIAALQPIIAARSTSHPTQNCITAARRYPDPNLDPFYRVSEDIGVYCPGQVIRSRPVVTSVSGLAVNSFQLFYATTAELGNATGTVATVWEPARPAFPPKVFSYQFAEDSLNIDCAPSWAWVNSSSTEAVAAQGEGSSLVPWALALGYYVVSADYGGADSAWLAGRSEGQAVLDGIRATIDQFGLPQSEVEVGLYGYSGAAHASAWAATLASTYAPDLVIAGAAHGGTPLDLLQNYNLLNLSPNAVLAGNLLFGLGNAYPELNATLTATLTDQGLNISKTVRSPNYCAVARINDFPNFNFSGIFRGDIFSNSVVQDVLARSTLLANGSAMLESPAFPRYVFHGTEDALVPYRVVQEYVHQQCAEGADIRFVAYPGLGHPGADVVGLPGAQKFLQQAFDHELTNVTCGSNDTSASMLRL